MMSGPDSEKISHVRASLIALIALFLFHLPTNGAGSKQTIEFSFREATMLDSNYQQMIAKYWNEQFDLAYTRSILSEYLWAKVSFGFQWERGNRLGVESGRRSAESIRIVTLRPTLALRGEWNPNGVGLFGEAGWMVVHYRITEKGRYPLHVNGFKPGLILRGGAIASIQKLFYRRRAFLIAEDWGAEDIRIELGAGYEKIRKQGVGLSNWSLSFGLSFLL